MDSMPVLSLEELDLLAVIDSGAEVVNTEDFRQHGLLLGDVVEVKSMHRVDAVGNLPGVRQKLTEGIGSLRGWHKGVHQKKTETHRKIIGLGHRARFGRYSGISSKFARRFVEGIGKLARNTLGDHWKKTGRLATRILEED
ncbi:hypothetical protein BHM03_00013488 [Ensete ventricosum]|nr:hypothetical protein BHM03_00013488 [Ensete ventricosum]